MSVVLANMSLTWESIHWRDPGRVLDGSPGYKIGFGIVICLQMIAGTMLHLGLIAFEHFGGDPQKRGLLNQVRPNYYCTYI